jgi:hypothetical protein
VLLLRCCLLFAVFERRYLALLFLRIFQRPLPWVLFDAFFVFQAAEFFVMVVLASLLTAGLSFATGRYIWKRHNQNYELYRYMESVTFGDDDGQEMHGSNAQEDATARPFIHAL